MTLTGVHHQKSGRPNKVSCQDTDISEENFRVTWPEPQDNDRSSSSAFRSNQQSKMSKYWRLWWKFLVTRRELSPGMTKTELHDRKIGQPQEVSCQNIDIFDEDVMGCQVSRPEVPPAWQWQKQGHSGKALRQNVDIIVCLWSEDMIAWPHCSSNASIWSRANCRLLLFPSIRKKYQSV